MMVPAKQVLRLAVVAPVLLAGSGLAAEPQSTDPGEYAQTCDAYGPGFVYFESIDTCVKISGYVRGEVLIRDSGRSNAEGHGIVPPGDRPRSGPSDR